MLMMWQYRMKVTIKWLKVRNWVTWNLFGSWTCFLCRKMVSGLKGNTKPWTHPERCLCMDCYEWHG